MSRIATPPAQKPDVALRDGTPLGLLDIGTQRIAAATEDVEHCLDALADPAMLGALIAGIEGLVAQVEGATQLLMLLEPGQGPALLPALQALEAAGLRAQAAAEEAWCLPQAAMRRPA